MAKLSAKKRNKLKKSVFGIPSERKYPMPDKAHARNAKARASQQYRIGNLSLSEKQAIDRKADKILKNKKTVKYKSIDEMREDYKKRGMY